MNGLYKTFNTMRLFVCGDIMPGGVLPYQKEYIDTTLLKHMSTFDFRIGTLECAVGNGLPFDEGKMSKLKNIIYVRNEDLFRIKEMGFDVVSLANNHVWDMGVEGLRNTISQLEKLGIQYCGAGMNIAEASRPAVVTKDGLSVAFLAYCMCDELFMWHSNMVRAGIDTPGVCPLDIDKVEEDIREAKKKYDKVVVLPHWGKEYKYTPLPETVAMAKRMIKAGADAVMGGHAHQVQPLVRLKGVPVCFSMGNFLFPDFYMQPPRPVWYPESSEDLTRIPDVNWYMYPLEESVRRVWKHLQRFSRAVEISVGQKRVTTKSCFTYNSFDNILSSAEIEKGIKKRLWKESGYIKFGVISLVKKIVRKLRRMLTVNN